MLFYYIQLKHAIAAQGQSLEWQQSPIPEFNMMAETVSMKGFISRCHEMLLNTFFVSFALKAGKRWERDPGPFVEDQ